MNQRIIERVNMDSNTFTDTVLNTSAIYSEQLPQLALDVQEEGFSDFKTDTLVAQINRSSGRPLDELVHELATSGNSNVVRILLNLFATGRWEIVWATHKGLVENFSSERAIISASRMLKDSSNELSLLKLVSHPIFLKNWDELQVEELIQLCTRFGQLSSNPEVRDRALYDGLYYLNLQNGGKPNWSKFSASMNKRECELQQLQFLYDLTESESLCRTEAISFLFESVSPGTSLLPKNRAKVGLKNVALKSGPILLREELLNGASLRQQQHAAQLLGRLKNTKSIPTLLEAFGAGEPELRATIKGVLDRYFPDVYQWYQQDIIS